MNADLEAEIAGMGPGFAALGAALGSAAGAKTSSGFTAGTMALVARSERRRRIFRAGWWTAAAAAVAAAFAVNGLFQAGGRAQPCGMAALVATQLEDGTFSASSAAPYVQAYAVKALADSRDERFRAALESAVAALVRGQSGEGGWRSVVESSCNVAALAAAEAAGVESARVPLRRGLRYLRANGICECPAGELGKAAAEAVRRMESGGDIVASLSRGA